MHEWDYSPDEKPQVLTDDLGRTSYDRKEPYNNLVTWVYDGGSYTPVAKLTEEDSYTIVQDYMGTPIQALDSKGEVVWDCILDIYGEVFRLRGERDFIPFRYQGQYFDSETDLCYNRFRYYSPESGLYISKDPISILGGLNVYAYVWDSNTQVDILGLEVVIGQVGKYIDLKKLSEPLDDIDIHHIPQDKLGFLPKNDGIAIAIPHNEHELTRTYGGRGKKTKITDQNRAFKDVLKDDLVDLRKIGGSKYDSPIKQIIKEYEDLGMLKKGELTLNRIKEACK